MSKVIRFNAGDKKDWFEIKNMAEKEADVYIYDEIGFFGTLAEEFIFQIQNLDVELINLHINSPGGSVFEGVAIYNALKNHKALISVHIDGLAASIASIIAMAGDEITIAENAMMMVHKPAVLMFGQAPELRKEADLLDKIEAQLVSTYTARTGQSEESIQEFISAETWFTGTEAVDAGFADKLSESKRIAASLNKWDLSLFENPPEVKDEENESTKQTPLSLLLRKQALIEKQIQ